MNIDLHSHFFPVEALQSPGKFENRAPKLVLENGKLSVTSQIGFRPGLRAGGADQGARSAPTARSACRRSRRRRFCIKSWSCRSVTPQRAAILGGNAARELRL